MKIWPAQSYGISTGRLPIQVRRKVVMTISQNRVCERRLNWYPLVSWLLMMGRRKRTRMAMNIATTPPSLLGIERRIA